MQQKSQKRPGFARTTISVPRRLKQRMNREGKLINWSAVATAAFRTKLNEADQQSQPRSLDSVVTRLQEAEQNNTPEKRAVSRGERCGRQWAMNTASKEHLQRLAEFHATFSDEEWRELCTSDACARKLALALDPDAKQPQRVWRQILQDRSDRQPLFYGTFAAAAIDLWKQVKDRL